MLGEHCVFAGYLLLVQTDLHAPSYTNKILFALILNFIQIQNSESVREVRVFVPNNKTAMSQPTLKSC